MQGVAEIAVDDALLRCQIAGFGDGAMLRQPCRCCHQHHLHLPKFAPCQIGIGRGSDTDRGIKPFVDQVHHAVGKLHIQRNLGVGCGEIGQQGGQFDGAKAERCGQPDQPAWRHGGIADFGFQIIGGFQQGAQAVGIGLTCFGQRQRSGGAVQQLDPQPRFQPRHQFRCLAGTGPQPGGCGRKAAGFHHFDKHPFWRQTVHLASFPWETTS